MASDPEIVQTNTAVLVVIITASHRLAKVFADICETLVYSFVHIDELDQLAQAPVPSLVIVDAVNTDKETIQARLSEIPTYVPILWILPADQDTDAVKHTITTPFTLKQALQAVQLAMRQTLQPNVDLPETLLQAMLLVTSPSQLFYITSQYIMNTLGCENLAILRVTDDAIAHWLYQARSLPDALQRNLEAFVLHNRKMPENWYGFPFLANELIGILYIESGRRLNTAEYDQLGTLATLTARIWQRESSLSISTEYIQSLQTFEMMGRSIVGVLDLNLVLDNVVRSMKMLLNCNLSMIWLRKGNRFQLARHLGKPDPIRREAEVQHLDPERLMIDNAFEATHIFLQTNQWFRTILVPLIAHNQTIGLLQAFNQPKSAPFSTVDEWRMRNLASWCVIAIENADLHRRAQLTLQRERMYRKRLVQAEKLNEVGLLVATVAHEVNNPLQIINSSVEYLRLHQDDPEVLETITIVEEASEQIAQVIQRIRHTYEVPQRDVSYFDLNDMLRRIAQSFRHRLQRSNLELTLHCDERVPTFAGFQHEIREVVLNIVQNAIDAVEHQPRGIIIMQSRYEPTSDTTFITIEDNGPGIATETQELIFDMFFTTKAEGSGIGLAVSRDIVKSHGGDIHVKSGTSGTTFTVELPHAQ